MGIIASLSYSNLRYSVRQGDTRHETSGGKKSRSTRIKDRRLLARKRNIVIGEIDGREKRKASLEYLPTNQHRDTRRIRAYRSNESLPNGRGRREIDDRLEKGRKRKSDGYI